MAFGAVQKFPNDTRPRVGIGVDSLPFNSGEEYLPLIILLKEAIKNNL